LSIPEAVDYFTNHRNKLRFPWSLYHRPIVEALREAIATTHGDTLLNLGSGPFFELEQLGVVDKRITLCDIDPRAIELAKQLHGTKISRADVAAKGQPLPYPNDTFDLIVSMDVIEHVPDPEPWVREALRVLRPSGVLFLTTPNYASYGLRVLEATALELIARRQGFSRKQLHPSKMTPARLSKVLEAGGGSQIEVRRLSLGWVLAAKSKKDPARRWACSSEH
jgi:SAM-dependent methyltransferase